MAYLDNIPTSIRQYFTILEPHPPKWLKDYIETPAMLRSASISNNCGMVYTDLQPNNFFYSNLDHSVGVAIVIWHFTHDKKQTLSGLFHDIATPTFKHCIDVMNGDGAKQESLEQLTSTFIKNSPEIMSLLDRDHINLGEVDNYHLYPIADNDSPRLASDRLEYSLSNALFLYDKLTFGEVPEIYQDIEIQSNEDNLPELGFKTKRLARKFVKATSEMSIFYRNERNVYSTRLISDILKGLREDGYLTLEDLYTLPESAIVQKIEDSKFQPIFDHWRTARSLKTSKEQPINTYSVRQPLKVRHIDPLVNGRRISKICKIASSYIAKNLAYTMNDYVYLEGVDQNLRPQESVL
ncbi:hypothetical protein IKF04_04245 [Candidatus Saccharibacteria bacterium]|nr:hypothetical protein [Candidatus Saccharibacteria bacterium]